MSEWAKKAEMANTKGWELLYAAMKCFELAEIAKTQERLEKKP